MEPGRILLVDDGELSEIAELLDGLGLAYTRLRGGECQGRIAPPRDLLVTTPRRAEVVRRGSPKGAPVGRPVRIIAVEEDSTAMRRMLRRMGFHLLVRLPCETSIWRLLIRRALYQGDERREGPRVAMGSPVSLSQSDAASGVIRATLLDISNRGCRLLGENSFELEAQVSIALVDPETGDEPILLRGRVARINQDWSHSTVRHAASIIFDPDLNEATRLRLGDLINRRSIGPPSMTEPDATHPPLPACESRAIPGLTLDDETDPSIRVDVPVSMQFEESDVPSAAELDRERRAHPRGAFTTPVVANAEDGRRVLMGRDLSAGGMRIERLPGVKLGDEFRLALYGPTPLEPFQVRARVIRDDGADGFALAFQQVEQPTAAQLEKLVACLPDVESLEEEEAHGMGAVLSELLEGTD